jgi:hypothetical protein
LKRLIIYIPLDSKEAKGQSLKAVLQHKAFPVVKHGLKSIASNGFQLTTSKRPEKYPCQLFKRTPQPKYTPLPIHNPFHNSKQTSITIQMYVFEPSIFFCPARWFTAV